MSEMSSVTILYRPVAQKELDLIEQSGWTKFPPRLPEQPIFYPVLNLEYARQITVDWNVPAYGNGYVTQFAVDAAYLKKFPVQNVGGKGYDELWIPAEELEEFNQHIVGKIEVVEQYFQS
ncbi:hypothetical protein QNI19_10240 [Cytophagaceae bacterium DM2B3-1]|uniref:ADP-ribosylation/crystallin J1 n=1 Tax=Xanthocytophaga flava TaxID=3048013 RepID=A0ABT7CJZ0_9BACT|nr:hypothetical protein [Xanthocytophaga flavus]MDJ1468425.1 hypothetical protein [Xanthocytophaga flavus]MDJ1493310.1 hypothetical protein [Xanthocytophaga flavus]